MSILAINPKKGETWLMLGFMPIVITSCSHGFVRYYYPETPDTLHRMHKKDFRRKAKRQ